MTALLNETCLRLIDVTRVSPAPGHDLVTLDDALTTLETMDRRKSHA